MAASFRIGKRLTLAPFSYFPGLRARMEGRKGEISACGGMNASWYGRRYHLSFTALAASSGWSSTGFSAAFKWSPGRVMLFGEAAARLEKGAFGLIGGGVVPFGEGWKTGVRIKVLPTAYTGKKAGDYSAAACLEYSSYGRFRSVLTGEFSLLPIRVSEPSRRSAVITSVNRLTMGEKYSAELRLRQRLRNYGEGNRTEARLDLDRVSPPWNARIRTHVAWSGGWGILSYLEGGLDKAPFKVYARMTGYYTSSWASRIYCYERDAPGAFSVSAHHGKGFSASVLCGYVLRWKKHRSLKLWCRGALSKNESRFSAGLRMQAMLDL